MYIDFDKTGCIDKLAEVMSVDQYGFLGPPWAKRVACGDAAG